MTMSGGVRGILISSVRNGSDLKQNLCTQIFINLNNTIACQHFKDSFRNRDHIVYRFRGINLSYFGRNRKSIVIFRATITSPASPSTLGSSQPITSNNESARITNTGTTTTTTTTITTTTTNSSVPTTTTEESGDLTQTISSLTPPRSRTFYLENTEISTINQTKLDIPPDVFSLTQITAKKGDTVSINFYDLEDLGRDNHSFTLIGGSYNIDKVLAPQQNGTITFKADQAGVFQSFCKYHAPSLTGQLIVLPTLASHNQNNTQQQQQLPSSSLSSTSTPPSSSSVSASIMISQGAATQQVKTYYLPNPSTVTADSKVTWNNKDIAPHTATATDGSFDTGILNVGSSGSVTVRAQGTVPYRCTIHPWDEWNVTSYFMTIEKSIIYPIMCLLSGIFLS
jgi:plastocyanin